MGNKKSKHFKSNKQNNTQKVQDNNNKLQVNTKKDLLIKKI